MGKHFGVVGNGCSSSIIAMSRLSISVFSIDFFWVIWLLFKSRPFFPGGKLRGSMGKLPEFPSTFLLGMCLLTHGYYVHCGLWRCLCKNHPGPPVYGLLHPWRFGKNPSHYFFLLRILHATNPHTRQVLFRTPVTCCLHRGVFVALHFTTVCCMASIVSVVCSIAALH